MAKGSVGTRIFWRCVIEFGPPSAIGLAWAAWNFDGTAANAVANFSAAFVTLGIVWANFLRIQYQQATRKTQEDAAGQISKVISDVGRVERLLQSLAPLVESIRNDLTPQQASELSGVVAQASSAIQSVQVDLTDDTVRAFLKKYIRRRRAEDSGPAYDDWE